MLATGGGAAGRQGSAAPDGREPRRVEAVAAAPGRGRRRACSRTRGDDRVLAGQRHRVPLLAQLARVAEVAVERRDCGSAEASCLRAAWRRCSIGGAGGQPLAAGRSAAAPYAVASSSSCAWARVDLGLPLGARRGRRCGRAGLAASSGRVETEQDGFGDRTCSNVLGGDRRSGRSRRSPGRSRRRTGAAVGRGRA